MTASSRGRVAIAALIAVVVFAAAFAVRRATAGETHTPSEPTPVTLPTTPMHVTGVALPATTVPALHRPPHPSAPAATTKQQSTTPATTTPSTPSTPATPSKPAAPSGSGPVLVG